MNLFMTLAWGCENCECLLATLLILSLNQRFGSLSQNKFLDRHDLHACTQDYIQHFNPLKAK
jgi:hypothetical protein